MNNLFHVAENQSGHYFIIEGKENAIKFAKSMRDGGSAPVFVKTVQVASSGVLWPDTFVYCADSDYPCLQNRIKNAELLASI